MIFRPRHFQLSGAALAIDRELQHVGEVCRDYVAIESELESADFKSILDIVAVPLLHVLAVVGDVAELKLKPRMQQISAIFALQKKPAARPASVQTFKLQQLAAPIRIAQYSGRRILRLCRRKGGRRLSLRRLFLKLRAQLIDLRLQRIDLIQKLLGAWLIGASSRREAQADSR